MLVSLMYAVTTLLKKIISPPFLLGLLMFVYGIILVRHAAYAVGGADATGYLNTARALQQRRLLRKPELINALDWPANDSFLFTPLGMMMSDRKPGRIVPMYPIGVPLQMVALAGAIGWKIGPYLVNPLSAVFSLLFIYLIALELGLSRWYALAAAFILALCPTVIFMALLPMSDVNAMLLGLITLYAALRARRSMVWAAFAGLAFGFGIFVRPANFLFILPVLAVFPWRFKSLLTFGLGGLPLALLFFAYNKTVYGQVLTTGYGAIGILGAFVRENFLANFKNYSRWIGEGLSPLILVGWLISLFDFLIPLRTRAMCLSWWLTFLIFYSFYLLVPEWWWTRFLLPAVPALILGTLLVLEKRAAWATAKFSLRAPWLQVGLMLILLVVVSGYALSSIRYYQVIESGQLSASHAQACYWANRQLPENSLVLSMEMSGTLAYYTKRPIVRYDYLRPAQWQRIQEMARNRGFRWYALLMAQELEDAQRNAPGQWTKLWDLSAFSLWQIESTP